VELIDENIGNVNTGIHRRYSQHAIGSRTL